MELFLIHALQASIAPIAGSFARLWPEARLHHLLDSSLSEVLAERGRLDGDLEQRFLRLGEHAAASGAQGILFTCSAFGSCIEAVQRALPAVIVRKPNDGLLKGLAGYEGRIALVASYRPTLESMPREFPVGVEIVPVFAAGALAALDAGDPELHDQLLAERASAVDADLIVLAQFSSARAAPVVSQRCGRPVLTTPDEAVRDIRALLNLQDSR